MDEYTRNDLLQDEIYEDRFQRQRHARHMALPPGHPDEPDDEGDDE